MMRWLALWALLGTALPMVNAGDLAAAAAAGDLWKKGVRELLGSDLLRGARFREVDASTLLLKRDAHVTLGGLSSGDVQLQVNAETLRPYLLSTTVYNKGDDGAITKAEFEARLADSQQKLTKLLGAEPRQSKSSRKDTGLRLRVWEWETENCAVRMEASAIGSGRKYSAEFIRLAIGQTKADLARGGADDAARRADLKANVKTSEKGNVWIYNVPMVDQGEKGYCVPASLSRVFAYYGMDGVDQHALAALCRSTGENGTTLEGMEKALRSISGAFHVGVTRFDWLSDKGLDSLVKKIRMSPEKITPATVARYIQETKTLPTPIAKGFKEIKKQIDAGIPVVWAVELGVFPEPEIPQLSGKHMRLIIGYNDNPTKRAIIYTDSWGARHELKMMTMGEACLITHALYVLRPKR